MEYSTGSDYHAEAKGFNKADMLKTGSGDYSFSGNLTVTGTFSGKLRVAGTLKLESGARVSGEISAYTLECDGKLTGTVKIESRAVFRKNAVVSGNINVPVAEIYKGASVEGFRNIARVVDINPSDSRTRPDEFSESGRKLSSEIIFPDSPF
jgi:cytoskeletal protein CcmA (bactofilin family)